MKYKLDFFPKVNVSAPSVSGAMVGAAQPRELLAWLPSTWPAPPAAVDEKFIEALKEIFEYAILIEVMNVIDDAKKSSGSLAHRGHVIAIALMCALDAVASYGYRGHHVTEFIQAHFRRDYAAFAEDIYELHRCSLVHSWSLFEAAIYPDDSKIKKGRRSTRVRATGFLRCAGAGNRRFPRPAWWRRHSASKYVGPIS